MPRTSAIVSSCSLPTPTASTYGSGQNGINSTRPSAKTPSLNTMAARDLLPTPTTRPESHATSWQRGTRKTLLDRIRERLLPTPVASDVKRGRGVHKRGDPGLALAVERRFLPTPTATDAKSSGTAGNWTKESGRHAGTTLTDAVVRTNGRDSGGNRLSPRFVEWMMGYPIGWTEIDPTDYTP